MLVSQSCWFTAERASRRGLKFIGAPEVYRSRGTTLCDHFEAITGGGHFEGVDSSSSAPSDSPDLNSFCA